VAALLGCGIERCNTAEQLVIACSGSYQRRGVERGVERGERALCTGRPRYHCMRSRVESEESEAGDSDRSDTDGERGGEAEHVKAHSEK
jgi:hypothetical protein